MKRLFVLLIACLLLGCQPTPEATEYRQEDHIMDDHEVSINVPDRYEKEETLPDGIKLRVKADVILPEGELSIGSVKRYPFDVSSVKHFGEMRPYTSIMSPSKNWQSTS